MAKRRRKTTGYSKLRAGLPGHYRTKSLVTVSQPLADAGDEIDDHWIVQTSRFAREWTVDIEHLGVRLKVPHKAVEAIFRHRVAIERAQASDSGKDAAQKRIDEGIVPFDIGPTRLEEAR
tara:strand:+ start:803 stop:1162 length:360 start_codon:yes stop_codon:yes gene_type:complete